MLRFAVGAVSSLLATGGKKNTKRELSVKLEFAIRPSPLWATLLMLM